MFIFNKYKNTLLQSMVLAILEQTIGDVLVQVILASSLSETMQTVDI